jgi:hypothetical protein
LFHYYGDYSTIYFLSREKNRERGGGGIERGGGTEREGKGNTKRERENKQTYLLYFLKEERRERINRLILCVF